MFCCGVRKEANSLESQDECEPLKEVDGWVHLCEVSAASQQERGLEDSETLYVPTVDELLSARNECLKLQKHSSFVVLQAQRIFIMNGAIPAIAPKDGLVERVSDVLQPKQQVQARVLQTDGNRSFSLRQGMGWGGAGVGRRSHKRTGLLIGRQANILRGSVTTDETEPAIIQIPSYY